MACQADLLNPDVRSQLADDCFLTTQFAGDLGEAGLDLLHLAIESALLRVEVGLEFRDNSDASVIPLAEVPKSGRQI